MKTIKDVLLEMLGQACSLEKLAAACEKEDPMTATAYRVGARRILNGWDTISKAIEYAEEEKAMDNEDLNDGA